MGLWVKKEKTKQLIISLIPKCECDDCASVGMNRLFNLKLLFFTCYEGLSIKVPHEQLVVRHAPCAVTWADTSVFMAELS